MIAESSAESSADPLGALLIALRDLRLRAGQPSSRAISRAIDGISHTTVANTFNGVRIPSWRKLSLIVAYLDGDEATIRSLWLDAVVATRRAESARRDALSPPNNPLAEPNDNDTARDVGRRLRDVVQRAPWYDDAQAQTDVRFLLTLLGFAPDVALDATWDDVVQRAVDAADAHNANGAPWRVDSGPSLYMCGHGGFHVRRRGQPGIVASFTAGLLDAKRLENILNDPATGANHDNDGDAR